VHILVVAQTEMVQFQQVRGDEGDKVVLGNFRGLVLVDDLKMVVKHGACQTFQQVVGVRIFKSRFIYVKDLFLL